jgi:hypothetical protein
MSIRQAYKLPGKEACLKCCQRECDCSECDSTNANWVLDHCEFCKIHGRELTSNPAMTYLADGI